MEISREEREFVIEQHKLHRLGPVALEKKIEKMYGIHIPHNRIYRILVEEGKIMRSKKPSGENFLLRESLSMRGGLLKCKMISGYYRGFYGEE